MTSGILPKVEASRHRFVGPFWEPKINPSDSTGSFFETMTEDLKTYNYVVYYQKEGLFCYSEQRPSENPRCDMLSEELDEIYEDCSRRNWDGYDAKPVTRRILGTVKSFLNALPTKIPNPELSADPDGEISLDWCVAPKRIFYVSIGKAGVLTYAVLDGDRIAKGVDLLEEEIPNQINSLLNNFFSD
jgi:hypothetical protein